MSCRIKQIAFGGSFNFHSNFQTRLFPDPREQIKEMAEGCERKELSDVCALICVNFPSNRTTIELISFLIYFFLLFILLIPFEVFSRAFS
jgi:hypothetical protein